MSMDKLRNKSSWGLLILRIATGLIFLVAGYSKLTGIEGITGLLTGLGFPLPGILAWLLALVEFFAGVALILGIYTRYAAIPLVVVAVVSTIVVYAGGMPNSDGGFGAARLDIMLLASTLALVFTGGGKCSIKEDE